MDQKFSKLNRIEEKYLVSREDASKIQKEVEKHLPPYFVEPGIKFEFIKSTYFDSDRLAFYRDHLNREEDRIKMRIRQYAPDGKWDPNAVFLELKEKDDKGETTKTRIQIDPKNLANLQGGKRVEITPELKALNTNQSPQRFHVFVKRANDYIASYRLKPILSVMYKRYAYQDKNLRVTIDFNIIYRTENTLNLMKIFSIINLIDWDAAKEYGKKYDTQKNAVVEIKYQSEEKEAENPEWIEQMLDDFKMEPTRFSKYAWSTFKLIAKILG